MYEPLYTRSCYLGSVSHALQDLLYNSFFILGLVISFSRQLMSLQRQSSIGIVPTQRHGPMKMIRCQKICKGRNEHF